MAEKRALMLNPKDNVANVMEDIFPKDEVLIRTGNETWTVRAVEKIPFGFKMAVLDILKGDPVLKYGEIIGKASKDIKKGTLVHIHNIEGGRGRGDLRKDG